MTVEAPIAPDGQIPEETPAVHDAPDAGTPSSSGSLTELSLAGLGLAEPVVPATGAPAEPVIGVRLLEGGIIEVALPPNREIEGPEARVAGETVRMLADGQRVPVLLVISGVVGVSVEARQVYAGSIAASAFALVGREPRGPRHCALPAAFKNRNDPGGVLHFAHRCPRVVKALYE